MRRAWLVLLASCQVYDPSLLGTVDAGFDAPAEACSTQCNGKCADLATDKNNCGKCGVTCETGCSDGLCTPTVLADGLNAPHGLYLHGGNLYVANHGSINVVEMSATDGSNAKNFATSQLFPERLASDGPNLFWTNQANVPLVPGGGIQFGAFDEVSVCGAPSYTVCYLSQGWPSPLGLSLQGDNMFVTTTDSTNNGPTGCAGQFVDSVLECPKFGCNAPSCGGGGPNVLATGTKLASITTDATNVYWADTGAHAIYYCPQPSCPGGPKVFASGLASPYDVVSDGSHVYFTDRAGTLSSCPISGCSPNPTVLANGLVDPLLIALDSKNVYVTLFGAGSILSCDLPTCAGGAKTIAKGLLSPYGITLDASYVYWTEEGTGGQTSQNGRVSKLRRQ